MCPVADVLAIIPLKEKKRRKNQLGFNFVIKWPPWTFYVVPFHVILNVLLIMLLGNVHPTWYKLYVVFICVMFQIKLLWNFKLFEIHKLCTMLTELMTFTGNFNELSVKKKKQYRKIFLICFSQWKQVRGWITYNSQLNFYNLLQVCFFKVIYLHILADRP